MGQIKLESVIGGTTVFIWLDVGKSFSLLIFQEISTVNREFQEIIYGRNRHIWTTSEEMFGTSHKAPTHSNRNKVSDLFYHP